MQFGSSPGLGGVRKLSRRSAQATGLFSENTIWPKNFGQPVVSGQSVPYGSTLNFQPTIKAVEAGGGWGCLGTSQRTSAPTRKPFADAPEVASGQGIDLTRRPNMTGPASSQGVRHEPIVRTTGTSVTQQHAQSMSFEEEIPRHSMSVLCMRALGWFGESMNPWIQNMECLGIEEFVDRSVACLGESAKHYMCDRKDI